MRTSLTLLAVLLAACALGQEFAPAPVPAVPAEQAPAEPAPPATAAEAVPAATPVRLVEPETVEVVFDPAVLDLFKEWLGKKTVDELRVEMYVPTSDAEAIDWLTRLLSTDLTPKQYGSKQVLTLPCPPDKSGERTNWLEWTHGLFQEQVLNKVEEEAQLAESVKQVEQVDAKTQRVQELQGKLDELKAMSAARFAGRDVEQLKQVVTQLDQEMTDLSLKRAESEARVKAIQDQLAEEKPVILLQDNPAAAGIPVLEADLAAAKQALEENQQKLNAGITGKADVDAAKAQLARAEAALTGAGGPGRETVNPIYVKLKEMLVDAETDLAATTARIQGLKALQAERSGMLEVAQEMALQMENLEREVKRIQGPPRPVVQRSPRQQDLAFPPPRVIDPRR